MTKRLETDQALGTRARDRSVTHARLVDLYAAIHACDRCVLDPACPMAPDSERVLREPIEEALSAEVMLLGESLGAKTQRLSGIPYINPDGSMLETGQTLDEFLNSSATRSGLVPIASTSIRRIPSSAGPATKPTARSVTHRRERSPTARSGSRPKSRSSGPGSF